MAELSRFQVAVEQAMLAAVQAARDAARKAAGGDLFAQGQVMAYHDVLDVLKEQVDLLGLSFGERVLAEFDPEELLMLSGPGPENSPGSV